MGSEAHTPVYHLMYVSTASRPCSAAELDDLLAISRRNNGSAGVTGMLVYGGGNFMQLLEGERAAVAAIFERIRRDPRHYDATELFALESPARWCGDWEMAFARYNDDRPIDGFVNLLGKGRAPLDDLADDHIAAKLMQGFIQGNR